MIPSIKRINARLGYLLDGVHGDAAPARTLRQIMKTEDRQWLIDTFDTVAEQDKQSYHPHDLVTLKMTALNQHLGGYGVEGIYGPESMRGPHMEYVNLGDTYLDTVIYDWGKARFEIGSWGDWVEGTARSGIKTA